MYWWCNNPHLPEIWPACVFTPVVTLYIQPQMDLFRKSAHILNIFYTTIAIQTYIYYTWMQITDPSIISAEIYLFHTYSLSTPWNSCMSLAESILHHSDILLCRWLKKMGKSKSKLNLYSNSLGKSYTVEEHCQVGNCTRKVDLLQYYLLCEFNFLLSA